MAASFPHFLYGDDVLKTYVDGLTPKKEAHDSFVIVEPVSCLFCAQKGVFTFSKCVLQLTGIPMESRARSQSNLVIKNLNGFSNQFHKFSNTIVPMFWAEYVRNFINYTIFLIKTIICFWFRIKLVCLSTFPH